MKNIYEKFTDPEFSILLNAKKLMETTMRKVTKENIKLSWHDYFFIQAKNYLRGRKVE